MDLQIINTAMGDASIMAEVTANNQLSCRSTVVTALHEATLNGDAYAWNSVSANIDATDVLLTVRNLSQTRPLVINRIYAWVDVPSALDIHIQTSTTAFATGTVVTGVNLNSTSSKAADAEAYTDDDGISQGTIVATLHTNEATADIFPIDFLTNDSIVLGTNGICSIDGIAEMLVFECTFIGYFIDT
ncbi:hypothetical protein LCGC14_0553580 [marine sediment metagenome]|uniref:Uncharacterized protein n=1 Tax=marine sediment metagenome TaxID=412755 RepID=A0A0F9UXF0_9ZZZZ